MNFQSREQFFMHYLQDSQAVTLNLTLCDVLHVWDDLIDKDKPVSAADINGAMRAALVEIPANPFYRQHFDQLHPLIDSFILSWMTATSLEADGGIEGLRIAYIARSDYMAFFMRSIQILHGFEFVAQHAPDIRRHWHQEGWDGYLVNLTQERINRERPPV